MTTGTDRQLLTKDQLPRIPPKHLKDGCYARADALEAHLNAAKAENQQLRGNLSLAEDGLAAAMQEIQGLRSERAAAIDRLTPLGLENERVRALTAMISDPRQWVQNEWTQRIASELRCILESSAEPSEPHKAWCASLNPDPCNCRDTVQCGGCDMGLPLSGFEHLGPNGEPVGVCERVRAQSKSNPALQKMEHGPYDEVYFEGLKWLDENG
jgi:hypothetical protein